MALFEEIEIDFENISSHKIDVAYLDHRSDEALSGLSLKPNECLTNAYLISKQKSGVSLVEGFLVTHHNDGDIQCVGHVWNLFEEAHVDFTYVLIDSQSVTVCEYYAFRTYRGSEKNIDRREIQDYNYATHELEPKTQEWLVFKTNVQQKALDYREYRKSKKENISD